MWCGVDRSRVISFTRLTGPYEFISQKAMVTTRNNTLGGMSVKKVRKTRPRDENATDDLLVTKKTKTVSNVIAGSVRIGNTSIRHYNTLADSTELFKSGHFEKLKERLDQDGVIFVRGVIPIDKALSARKRILEFVASKNGLDPSVEDVLSAKIRKENAKKFVEGWTADALSGGVTGDRDDDVEGWLELGTNVELTQVFDGSDYRNFVHRLFSTQNIRFMPENTWIRVKGQNDVTVEHADYYYFKRSTSIFVKKNEKVSKSKLLCTICGKIVDRRSISRDRLIDSESHWHCSDCADSQIPYYTCWMSLSEVDISNSTLGFIPGTHKLDGFDRPPIGKQVTLLN